MPRRLGYDPAHHARNNGQAILRVPDADGQLQTVGTLPLTLSGTLPVSGEYVITVEQALVEASQRFRGTYHVIVESPSGTPLEPLVPSLLPIGPAADGRPR